MIAKTSCYPLQAEAVGCVAHGSLELLLWAQLVGVSTLLLPAVLGTRVQASVAPAMAADKQAVQ